MFDAIYSMFAPSPRPSKRRKTDAITEPDSPTAAPVSTRSTRSQRSSKAKYSSTALTQSYGKIGNSKTTSRSEQEEENGAGTHFHDSAYHSMGTSPDNSVDGGTITISQSRRPGQKRGDKDPADQQLVIPSIDHQSNSETLTQAASSEDEGSTIVVRTSGRARKQTWKSVEHEAELPKAKERMKSLAARSRTGTPQPSIGNKTQAPASSKAISRTATKPDSAKKSPLKMPSRHSKVPADREEDPIEEVEQIETPSHKSKSRRAQVDLPIEPLSTPKKPSAAGGNDIFTGTKHATPRKTAQTPSVTPSKRGRKNATSATETELLESYKNLTIKANELQCLRRTAGNDDILSDIRDCAMRYITGTGLLPIYGEGHHNAYQKVFQILEQTVSAGEGNSMLLIGARATAKSNIINTALEELRSDFKDQFHVIRLNGVLHTDDKLALKEIWRQLGKEMAVDDDSMGDRGNYADTLASLLALLSQPEEFQALGKTRTTSRSVIFILDEFDLFTTHPRQTLLYNLFDIAQSRKAPIAVLGVTTRIDVVEGLEKRVKSRFSHRYAHVTHPKSFPVYMSIIRAFLVASAQEEDSEENVSFRKSPAIEDLSQRHKQKFQDVYRTWSNYIDALFSDPSVALLLNRHYSQTKSPQSFLNAFLTALPNIPNTLPLPKDLILNGLEPVDSNLSLLVSLTDASLALLISAARLDIICDTDTVTFNMAYDEYVRLAQRSRLVASASGMIAVSGSASGAQKGVLGREVALAAWEQLEGIGLLSPVAHQGGYGQAQGAMVDLGRGGKLVRVDVGLEEIGGCPGIDLGSMAKWCKEI